MSKLSKVKTLSARSKQFNSHVNKNQTRLRLIPLVKEAETPQIRELVSTFPPQKKIEICHQLLTWSDWLVNCSQWKGVWPSVLLCRKVEEPLIGGSPFSSCLICWPSASSSSTSLITIIIFPLMMVVAVSIVMVLVVVLIVDSFFVPGTEALWISVVQNHARLWYFPLACI